MAGVDHGQTSGRSEAEQLVGWYLTGMGPFYGDVAAATDSKLTSRRFVPPIHGRVPAPSCGPERRAGCSTNSRFSETPRTSVQGSTPGRLADVVAVGVGPGEVDAVSALIEAAAPGQTAWSQTSTTTSAAVLTAPDGCTTFRTSSIPTARQIADWCHPRSDPGPRLCDSVAGSVAPPAQHHPVERPSTHAAKHPTDLTTRLLGIWAHPDDEAYLSAGLMARTIADGGHVTVVAITDGDAGFPDDDPRSSEQRAAQRRRELRAAMALIGVHDVRFLGIADGAVATTPADRLVAEIGHIIRDVDPDAILTFGPDGITGHDDHVANSDLVTRAWLDTRIGELWYAAKTNEWLAEWRELHDDFGVWMTEEPTGVGSEDLELIVGLEGTELDTKRAVLAEHRSQTVGWPPHSVKPRTADGSARRRSAGRPIESSRGIDRLVGLGDVMTTDRPRTGGNRRPPRRSRTPTPFAVALIPFGMALGGASAAAGLSSWESVFGGVALLAGAAQLAAVEMIGAGGGVALVAVVVALINMRFVFYGAGFARWFADAPLRAAAGPGPSDRRPDVHAVSGAIRERSPTPHGAGGTT